MANNAKRHHFVSACYLKHFAVPQDRHEGRLHAYDRATGRSLPPMSPDASAFERHFYRVDVEGEDPNLVETVYETLESLFAPTLAAIAERSTLPTEKPQVAP